MLKVLFTLDYEIHGNGEGCPRKLMLEPTWRMLELFEQYGAKLTILADVAEILKFKEYQERFGRDDYCYGAIAQQLREALRRGHDVQLHLHSSYFNARYEAGRWVQDWSEYNFAGLSLERLREIIRIGKEFLEKLLRPIRADYSCHVFRAANWSVSPSANVVRALVENGFTIDTSVFKHGQRQGLVQFDYTNAWSALVPWRAAEADICACSEQGELMEFPIYSEARWLGAFLTPQRVYRACVSRLHRFSHDNGPYVRGPGRPAPRPPQPRRGHPLFRRHAWKADFNQCSGHQLVRALDRAELQYGGREAVLPFVLIGHSKLFTRFNAWSLRPFLAYVARRSPQFGFGTFGDFKPQRPHASLATAA